MGMALKNLASAMNNTQALETAAIILGSESTPIAIAYRADCYKPTIWLCELWAMTRLKHGIRFRSKNFLHKLRL